MVERSLKNKMRSFFMTAVLSVMIIMLASCNKAGTTPTTDNTDQNIGTDDISNNGSTVSDAQTNIPATSAPSPTPILTPTPKPKPTATPTPTPLPEPKLDLVDMGYKAFRNTLKRPCFSLYAAYKNNCDQPIMIVDMAINFEDNDGRLLATDQMVQIIPRVIKPGQTGYIYSYYFDISDIDYSNGFVPVTDGELKWADDFYEIEVSDVSFKKGWSDHNVEVIGRGTNNTGKNLNWVVVGAVFYDKNDTVLGFCYDLKDFPDGKTTTFSISGDTMSPEVKVSEIDHVQVFIQGNK